MVSLYHKTFPSAPVASTSLPPNNPQPTVLGAPTASTLEAIVRNPSNTLVDNKPTKIGEDMAKMLTSVESMFTKKQKNFQALFREIYGLHNNCHKTNNTLYLNRGTPAKTKEILAQILAFCNELGGFFASDKQKKQCR
ncbi:uncharacterized protein MELLADRAFT_63097 [Melampsora larici-populina 98AG31]|uniref:Uncharacterized protein n=1 Tax=Melampsora larici-populina (strain 98AG31 / pathotype 3-4-7) TaxID=747676 RepID=F4RLA2_MELLP|nr:uncharacterized protein MELLADRAFT_63097 [Melampsora larici-populina 98AG31]EGG06874.1 hypothetical protein MELLADRAFT_63097 [Melampsora larici-populina 98AG31]